MAIEQIPNSTVPTGSTEVWRDKKRYLWLIGLVVPSLAFVAAGAYIATGWGAWLWIGPIVILVVVPALDLPLDHLRVPPAPVRRVRRRVRRPGWGEPGRLVDEPARPG